MSTVTIRLRSAAPARDEHGDAIMDGDRVVMIDPPYEEIDLGRLSPRARALAEAVAASGLSTAADIWMESDTLIRDRIPDWEHWYTPEQAARPERRPWRGWSAYPATSTMDPHTYLEQQAAKIPAGWHVLGPEPARPVPTQVYGLTVDQVIAYLKTRGRRVSPSTWRSYVARHQAPKPASQVGATPLWDPGDIVAWATRPSMPGG